MVITTSRVYVFRPSGSKSNFLKISYEQFNLPEVLPYGSPASKKICGFGTILLMSWAQWPGKEPLIWTKDDILARFRFVIELSPTICSLSTSFATSPWGENLIYFLDGRKEKTDFINDPCGQSLIEHYVPVKICFNLLDLNEQKFGVWTDKICENITTCVDQCRKLSCSQF